MAKKIEEALNNSELPQEGITLGNLRPARGAVRAALRVGRGHGSGAGKTCNRGHRGEGQRSGRSKKRGFEGGQMPLYRRIPKFRRFTPPYQKEWLVLNVKDLPSLVLGNETDITYALLRERGFMKSGQHGLRILGTGEMSQKLNIEAHHVSPSAMEKIQAAGGSVIIVEDPLKNLKQRKRLQAREAAKKA